MILVGEPINSAEAGVAHDTHRDAISAFLAITSSRSPASQIVEAVYWGTTSSGARFYLLRMACSTALTFSIGVFTGRADSTTVGQVRFSIDCFGRVHSATAGVELPETNSQVADWLRSERGNLFRKHTRSGVLRWTSYTTLFSVQRMSLMVRRVLISILALSLIAGIVFASNAQHKSKVEAAKQDSRSLAGVVTLPLDAGITVNEDFGVTVRLADGREVSFPGCHVFALYLRSHAYRVNARLLAAAGRKSQQYTFQAFDDPTCMVSYLSEETQAGAYIKVTLREGNRETPVRELF